MTAAKPEIKRLEFPLAQGLSQKEDPLWLGQGKSSTATNLIAAKAGTLKKRAGTTLLNTLGAFAIPSGSAPTLASGTQLVKFNDNLHILGAESTTNTLGIWSYDDASGTPALLDRVPEVYCLPPVTETAFPASATEMDSGVANGVRILVYLAPAPGGTGNSLYWQAKDAVTGQVLYPFQLVNSTNRLGVVSNYAATVVKLVMSGNIAVLAFYDGSVNNALGLDTTNLSAGWWNEPATPLSSGLGGGVTVGNGLFDVSATAGDTTRIAMILDGVAGGNHNPYILRVLVDTVGKTFTVQQSSGAIDNKNTALDGCCVRSDSVGGYVWCGYSYRLLAGNREVRVASQTWPTVTVVNKAPFTLESVADSLVIQLMDIARTQATVNGQGDAHMIAWSPIQQFLGANQWIKADIVDKVNGSESSFNFSQTFGVTLASRIIPFVNGIGYVVGYTNSVFQGSFFLLAIDDWSAVQNSGGGKQNPPMRDVGHLSPRQSSGTLQATGPYQDNAHAVGGAAIGQHGIFANHFTLPHTYQNTGAQGGNVWEVMLTKNLTNGISAPTLYQFDFASPLIGKSDQLGSNAIVATGMPVGFDGAHAFDLAFPYYPEVTAISAQGAGLFAAGNVFNYIAIYEQRDLQGNIHRSARSPVFQFTVGGGGAGEIDVTIATCGISNRSRNTGSSTLSANSAAGANTHNFPPGMPIIIRLYRSSGTSPASPAIYYNIANSEVVSGNNVKTNSIVAGTVQLADLTSVANLTLNSLLYNDGSDGSQPGNLLDNLCAPASQAIITHKNRIWSVDGNNIWLSKALLAGEGSGFNEATAFSVDDGPSAITALASMDDKLIIFKNDRIFYMTGEGPFDNGLENDLTPPTRIPSDVGANDWRSVVTTPKGVWFQSANGLYLLTRDLQVLPAGKNVEDVLVTNPIITSATLNTATGEVRFTANTDDSSSPRVGVTIVYNYVLDVWTTESHAYGGGPTVQGAIAALVTKTGTTNPRPNTYHLLQPNGVVERESATSWQDNGAFVPLTWESPWVKAESLTNWGFWQNIRIAMSMNDPATVTVSVGYDYNTTYSETHTATITNAVPWSGTYPWVETSVQPKIANAKAIRVKIVDSSNSGTSTGQGPTLASVALEYGILPGSYPIPTGQRI